MKACGRPWLLTIHCVSHRLELAIKDSLLKHSEFVSVKDMMITIFYVMKQSRKFKRQFHATAEAPGVHLSEGPRQWHMRRGRCTVRSWWGAWRSWAMFVSRVLPACLRPIWYDSLDCVSWWWKEQVCHGVKCWVDLRMDATPYMNLPFVQCWVGPTEMFSTNLYSGKSSFAANHPKSRQSKERYIDSLSGKVKTSY